MILSIFRKKPRAQSEVSIARIPAGQRVYAIGDIHGRDDLFADLLALISADDAARPPALTTLILLGDLMDRGPESKQVIDRAIAQKGQWAGFRWLIGNHEEVMLRALGGDPKLVRYFVRIGGGPTIQSYGIDGQDYADASFEDLAEQWPALVPPEHAAFLAAGEDQIAIGDYLFVHAGVRPGVSLDDQAVSDLRWIRDEFLDDARDHGAMIVHGHTIADDVQERGNRIGIDTGAYASGKLTAIGLEDDQRWYLST